jgi:hypothetical protein
MENNRKLENFLIEVNYGNNFFEINSYNKFKERIIEDNIKQRQYILNHSKRFKLNNEMIIDIKKTLEIDKNDLKELKKIITKNKKDIKE